MDDKKLKKLRRVDLLEMLVALSKENENLKKQLKEANAELAKRKIDIKKSGSIAEAALKLNGVFEAAQKAADQYLANIKRR